MKPIILYLCLPAPVPRDRGCTNQTAEDAMKVSFPAMRGVIGRREYFSTMMALSEIPHLFKFNDWEQFTPELRAQRVLVKARVPEIVKYIVDNEDSYIFASITAAYQTHAKFKPVEDGADIGYLEMDLEDAKFLIND